MRFHFVKSSLNRAVGISIVLLLGASLALAQQQVNLSAGPSVWSCLMEQRAHVGIQLRHRCAEFVGELRRTWQRRVVSRDRHGSFGARSAD